MAKKKTITAGALRSAVRAASAAISDPKTAVLGNTQYKLCGLNIPLSLQYLLDCNVWPLGTCMELSGESDSNKTTLLFELGRMFYNSGGWLDLILTESKYSPELAYSVMGWPDELEFGAPLVINRGESMNQWQKMLNGRINTIKEWQQKGAKIKTGRKLANGQEAIIEIPAGSLYPVLFGIDSIMGQNVESTTKKVDAEGASGRGFAVEAGALTVYLRELATKIADWPFSAVYINHGKVDKIDDYNEVYRTPGGNQAKFQATYRIRSRRVRKFVYAEDASVAALFRRGYILRLDMYKSSLGEGYRSIRLPFSWSYRKDKNGQTRQYSVFDWDAALVFLILAVRNDQGFKDEGRRTLADKLDAIVHLRPDQSAEIPTTVKSKNFGNESLTPTELGKLISQTPEMVQGIRDAFGIKCYTAWDGTIDFFKLRQKMHAQMIKDAVTTPA